MVSKSLIIDNSATVRIWKVPTKSTWIILALIAYAFIYDNSTSLPITSGYSWTRLVSLPRQIRYVEIAIIFLLTIMLIAHRFSRSTLRLLTLTFIFVCLSFFSYSLSNIDSPIDSIRLTYAYILPILIFIIGREATVSANSREIIFWFLVLWVTISAGISWYQFIVLNYPVGDNITGLNKDAHINGNLLVFISLFLVSRSMFLRKLRYLLFAIILIVTMILTSVFRTTIFSVFAFGLLGILFFIGQRGYTRRTVVTIFVFLLLATITFVAFVNIDILTSERTQEVVEKVMRDPSSFGPIRAHARTFELISTNLKIFLIGSGPFSVGNPISVGQLLEEGKLSQYAQEDILFKKGEHGEDTRITLTSSILEEFGSLTFLVFVLLYGSIYCEVCRANRSIDKMQKSYAAGLCGIYLIIFLTSLSSLGGSLEVISVTWPIMLLAGMTCKIESTFPSKKIIQFPAKN